MRSVPRRQQYFRHQSIPQVQLHSFFGNNNPVFRHRIDAAVPERQFPQRSLAGVPQGGRVDQVVTRPAVRHDARVFHGFNSLPDTAGVVDMDMGKNNIVDFIRRNCGH